MISRLATTPEPRRRRAAWVRTPGEAVSVAKALVGRGDEEWRVVCYLDTEDAVIGVPVVRRGVACPWLVDPAPVCREARACHAASLVVVSYHHHPFRFSRQELLAYDAWQTASRQSRVAIRDVVVLDNLGWFFAFSGRGRDQPW